MPLAAAETPEKPSPPAMIEITKAMMAYFRTEDMRRAQGDPTVASAAA